MNTPKVRLGFTLIELLVVLTVIGLLAALLFPVFAKAREGARRITCLSNERQVGMAMLQYVADNDERFPSEGAATARVGDGWVSLCCPYIKTLSVLRCPDDGTLPFYPGPGLPTYYSDSYGVNANVLGWSHAGKTAAATGDLSASARSVILFEVGNDVTATIPQSPPAINGSAAGNGGGDCGGTGSEASPTFPCGTSGGDPNNTVPLYMTGDIGGRILNGGAGSVPRHVGGANYVACDGHAAWLRPETVSGGRSQSAGGVGCGQDDTAAGCGGVGAAAGTGSGKYVLTFSVK